MLLLRTHDVYRAKRRVRAVLSHLENRPIRVDRAVLVLNNLRLKGRNRRFERGMRV